MRSMMRGSVCALALLLLAGAAAGQADTQVQTAGAEQQETQQPTQQQAPAQQPTPQPTQQQAQQQQQAAAKVVPAAADQAPKVDAQVGLPELQQLGECTADTGISSHLDRCATTASLTKPGESHWYRLKVSDDDKAFSLHLLMRVQNGRVRVGLWAPGQKLDEPPTFTPQLLLSSSFAQELFITLTAQQVFTTPGDYMLQVINEYGAPQYALSADITPGMTLLAEDDKAAIRTIVTDCCANANGLVCSLLSQGLEATSFETDLCHQGAVQCDAAGHITDLVLQGTDTETDLTCPSFSAGFAALPALERLDLAGARLGADLATIAAALQPAGKLKWLVLRTAGVVGELSCDIILPTLQLLSLTRNGITGPIPECFTHSPNLRHLYLSDNALSGQLPDFSADAPLQLLFARNQQSGGEPTLTGALPASLGAAAALHYLQLANNGLSGSVPELPANLRYFNVSSNALEGALPALPAPLISLDVSANRLSGKLPADMSALTGLVDIQAYYNELEGELPAALPPSIIQLALTGNRLTGQIPQLPPTLKYLSLAENGLSGALPSSEAVGQLWFADLSTNGLSGAVPAALTQSAQLVYLNVSNNQLSGFEAPDTWATPSLITLDASFNAIAGPLPAKLAAQPRLAYINLASNSLSGSLDEFATALVPDGEVGSVFDVSHNQLTGGLPNALSNLAAFDPKPVAFPSWNPADASGSALKVFNVADNRLAGPFPAFLYSNLTSIMTQYCAGEDGCHLWVAVDGGANRLACPTKFDTHSGLLPEDFTHLAKQRLGCVGSDGALYELSSVLAGGKLVKLAASPDGAATKPAPATATTAAGADGAAKAAARQAADAKAASNPAARAAAAVWDAVRPRGGRLPPAGIAALVVGCALVVSLLAALGYIFIYRRIYTVRAARRYQKFHEGPLAAAGGATINSSAPNASLGSLQPPRAGGAPADGADVV